MVDRIAASAGARWRDAGEAEVGVCDLSGRRVVLAKPRTFMNLSGIAAAHLFRKHADGPEDLVVVHDDLDLQPGAVRLKRGGGTGGHNGLRDVEDTLRSREYARLRVGVGPVPEGLDDLADYVLDPFTRDEMEALDPLWPVMVDAVECWVTDGIEEAMQRFNKRGAE